MANLSKFSKGAYISGIKVFNQHPQYIKALTDIINILNPHRRGSYIIILSTQ